MKMTTRSGVVATVLMLMLLALFIALGIWQLDRAEQREAQYLAQKSRAGLPALELTAEGQFRPEWEYRLITLRGTFGRVGQILLDNRIHNGQAGYEVVTPLHVKGLESVVMVNRGWVPTGRDRTVLPELHIPAGEVVVHGQVKVPAPPHFRPGVSVPGPAQGGVWLYLDMQYLQSHSELPLQPFVILQAASDAQGYVREWPEPESKSSMHTGYAIQWFSFAALLLGVYVWVVIKQVREGSSK